MLSSNTKKDIKNLKKDAQSDLQRAANEAGRKVRSIYENANGELSNVGDRVSAEIKDNPVRASLIALGVGVVLGALLRR